MKKALAVVLALAAIVVSAQPAFGDDVGTVSAQVTVAAPCIQVSPGQLDFGTLALTPTAANITFGTRGVTATNCGAAANLLARGTNATSTGGTTWTLEVDDTQLCAAPNRYGQRVSNGASSFPLTAGQDQQVRLLAAAEAAPLEASVEMPCAGSSGAGQTMTFSYIFTAVSS